MQGGRRLFSNEIDARAISLEVQNQLALSNPPPTVNGDQVGLWRTILPFKLGKLPISAYEVPFAHAHILFIQLQFVKLQLDELLSR